MNAPLDAWNAPEGWFPSSVDGGTPGGPDSSGPPAGLVLPGDTSLDGHLDLSDPIDLLIRLFQGSGEPPPCGGSDLGTGGNLELLDSNGDGTVDLSDAISVLQYLFLGGAPHVLGEACVPIEGCPRSCGG